MTETSQARRAEIALRARCATDGRWEWDESGLRAGNGDLIVWPANVPSDPSTWAQRLGACGRSAELVAEANANFIARARDDIPWLLAELSRLTAQVEGMRTAAGPFIECVESKEMQRMESNFIIRTYRLVGADGLNEFRDINKSHFTALAAAARPGVEKETEK